MDYQNLTEKQRIFADKYRNMPAVQHKNLLDSLRVELTYNSNAIEGNTLTLQETALVIDKDLSIGGKTVTEHLEARNHALALDWIMQQVQQMQQIEPMQQRSRLITEQDILQIHSQILQGIDDQNRGCYRSVSVRISGSTVVLPNPVKVPELMQEFKQWLILAQHDVAIGTLHPVALAAEAHYRLVTIHPFIDGNGRTTRLLMNMILLLYNYPITIIPVSKRLQYLNALEQAQLGGSKDPYLDLVNEAVSKALDLYLQL